MTGPTHYHRHTRTTLKGTVFTSAQSACRRMPVEQLLGSVIIPVIHHRSVIARQYHKRIIRYTETIECIQYPSHAPVKLHYSITTNTHCILAPEPFVRESRHMDIVRGKIHEKRLTAMLTHISQRMLCYGICYILILPQCLTATLHIAYSAYSVHYRLVMSMARQHIIQQFRIILSGRFALEITHIAHLYRSVGIIIGNHAVLYEHTRHTVGSGGHYI